MKTEKMNLGFTSRIAVALSCLLIFAAGFMLTTRVSTSVGSDIRLATLAAGEAQGECGQCWSGQCWWAMQTCCTNVGWIACGAYCPC